MNNFKEFLKQMQANKPAMADGSKLAGNEVKPLPHHSGKGTKARLNTAAEKHFFNSQISK